VIEPVLGKDVAELLELEVAQMIAQSILSDLCMDGERVNDTWLAAMSSLGWAGGSVRWFAGIESSTKRLGESW
jgi:hypothetical protein